MKQQYVLLRQENDLLNELRGRTFNDRLKDNALKILNEIHDKADYNCMEKSLVYVVRDGMVKGLGGSTLMKNTKTGKLHSDLLLNNFGLFYTGLFRGVVGTKTVTLTDEGGVATAVRPYSTSETFNDTTSFRILLQVGSGLTAPARADINVETAFGTAPESNFFESTRPVYNVANSNYKNNGQITAGGAGTVNESIFQHFMGENVFPQSATVTMFRDTISPGVPFIIGDGIILEYTTQI